MRRKGSRQREKQGTVNKRDKTKLSSRAKEEEIDLKKGTNVKKQGKQKRKMGKRGKYWTRQRRENWATKTMEGRTTRRIREAERDK